MITVINRTILDTEKSKFLGKMEQDGGQNFSFIEEKLYRSPKGIYFIFGEGGAMTSYATHQGNSSSSGYKSWIVEVPEILDWIEKNSNYMYKKDIENILKEIGDEVEEG